MLSSPTVSICLQIFLSFCFAKAKVQSSSLGSLTQVQVQRSLFVQRLKFSVCPMTSWL